MSAWVWCRRDGVGFWRVAPLEAATPCAAAFSSRLGGVSDGPYATLNLGGYGDDPRKVAENRRRFGRAVGFDPAMAASVRQVHGDGVVEVRAPGPQGEGDALWTRAAGPVLTVFVADCVPVFLLDPDRRAAALIHAGWRGSAAGVTRRALEALLAEPGGRPGDPSRVDAPVIARFPPEVLRPGRPGHARLDLWEENRRQLTSAGVRAENVHVAGICTLCEAERLFSHRRGGGRTGHMAAVLQLR
jgi:copper oxidase (laccase) domain-containing protein